jgi:hypothetical protein
MSNRFGYRAETNPLVSQWLNGIDRPLGVSYDSIQGQVGSATLTADVSAHTYGPWTELVASLPNDTSALSFDGPNVQTNTVNTATILSVGVGAASSETELFAVAVGSGGVGNTFRFTVPVFLPAGTRVAARIQSVVTGGKTGVISLYSYNAPSLAVPFLPKFFDSLGLDFSNSKGTTIATNSTYTEIVASTSNPYQGLVLVPSASNALMDGRAFVNMTVAVGPAGSEVDLGSIVTTMTTNEVIIVIREMVINKYIPAGSRLSVKQTSNSNRFDASLIGLKY